MARITFSQEGLTPFQQLLGHNKYIMKKWTSLEECFFNSNTFTHKLKEEVRRTLALITDVNIVCLKVNHLMK